MAAGFECEFVVEPQNAFQSECPVCLLVLREPYQATCCGKSFCKECIESVKVGSNKCPTCKTEDFFSYPNKGLQQSLYDFKVYCLHKSKGCEWTGELRELDNHLNSDPPADKSLEGCPFAEISCPLGYAGCEVKLHRKDMSCHLEQEAIGHLLLQARKQNLLLASMENLHKENKELRLIIREVQAEKQYLEQRVTDLEATTGTLLTNYRQPMNFKVVEFIMKDFEKLKRDGAAWYSTPFYSHHRGYKMCLQVNANGLGQGRRGPSKFIPLTDLRPKFLRNDCLRFRVIKVELR